MTTSRIDRRHGYGGIAGPRGWALALGSCLAAACVGTNPDWDEPTAADEDEGDGDGGDDGGDDDGDDGSTSDDRGDAPDPGGPGGPGGPADTDGATDDTGGPTITCEDREWMVLCDGMCRRVKDDPHACGVACVDCTALGGKDAKCKNGSCTFF